MQWAILGTGSVSRKFCLGLRALGAQARVGAVASRTPQNAQALVASLGLGHAVAGYEEAIADPGTDVVYIATPAELHETHAKLAFAAGKPTLIEKPLAADADAAARIAEAAAQAGVFAMEAMWTRFLPLTGRIAELARTGELDELRGFHGSFLAANRPDPQISLFRPGGGALLHRGIYPLALAQFFLGPIDAVQATARLGDSGVDEDIVLTLTHASGALSDIRASLRTSGANACALWGSSGRIEIDGPVWRPAGARLIPFQPAVVSAPQPRRFEAFRESRLGQRIADWRNRLRGGGTTLPTGLLGNGYAHEAQHLMQQVAAGNLQSPVMPLEDSVALLRIIDTARAQVGAR